MDYRIRRSSRSRRIRVSVDPSGEVEVILPQRATLREAEAAVVELRPWIERRRRTLARVMDEVALPPGFVPYLDSELELLPQPGRERVHRRADFLHVPTGDPRPALERWYRRQARAEILPRLDAACARAGTRHSGLTIREQKTRWASCSTTRKMSFNWRLLLAPERVLDYVVEHEVCHLEIMDHSPRFWALLESRVPDWKEPSGWLRRYGATLALGPTVVQPDPGSGGHDDRVCPAPSSLRSAA